MKKTYEFKNEKYNIIGYTISDDKESLYYKTDIVYGIEDHRKWILNINGKEIAFWNTGNNIVCNEHVIIEDDELNIITDFDYFKINLETFECLAYIDLSEYMNSVTCDLIKYNNGFLIICDLELVCLENNKVKWVYDSDCGLENVKVLEDNIIKLDILDAYGLYMYTAYLNSDGKQIKKH